MPPVNDNTQSTVTPPVSNNNVNQPINNNNNNSNTKIAKPVIKSLKNIKNKKISVTLKKSIKNANGYEIRYSAKKNMKSSKKVTIKKASVLKTVIKGLKKKTYYVQARTYKYDNEEKYYSEWSVKKKVKVKK